MFQNRSPLHPLQQREAWQFTEVGTQHSIFDICLRADFLNPPCARTGRGSHVIPIVTKRQKNSLINLLNPSTLNSAFSTFRCILQICDLTLKISATCRLQSLVITIVWSPGCGHWRISSPRGSTTPCPANILKPKCSWVCVSTSTVEEVCQHWPQYTLESRRITYDGKVNKTLLCIFFSRFLPKCSLLGDIMNSLDTSTLGWSPGLLGAYIT